MSPRPRKKYANAKPRGRPRGAIRVSVQGSGTVCLGPLGKPIRIPWDESDLKD